ncbi:MAG: hypothetical protein WBB48_02535 [Thermodesulfobacteriota bacterium]
MKKKRVRIVIAPNVSAAHANAAKRLRAVNAAAADSIHRQADSK